MQLETRKFLYDIQSACELLLEFSQGKTLENYQADLLLRSGIERQLEIIGEAMSQAQKIEPDLDKKICGVRQIINLRNVIIHGYSTIQNETIWGILQNDLPTLYEQVRNLLGEKKQ